MSGRQPRTEVPDVVGLEADDACDIVRRGGLVPYGPNYETAPDTGVVTAQRPVAAAEGDQGTPVFLWTTDTTSPPASLAPTLSSRQPQYDSAQQRRGWHRRTHQD